MVRVEEALWTLCMKGTGRSNAFVAFIVVCRFSQAWTTVHITTVRVDATQGVTVRILTANTIAESTIDNVHSVPVLFARNAVRFLTVRPCVASTQTVCSTAVQAYENLYTTITAVNVFLGSVPCMHGVQNASSTSSLFTT